MVRHPFLGSILVCRRDSNSKLPMQCMYTAMLTDYSYPVFNSNNLWWAGITRAFYLDRFVLGVWIRTKGGIVY